MSDTPASPSDPSRCPLCGGDNRCAMEIERATGQPQPACWCMSQTFPPALLDRLPPQAQGLACICARCVAVAVAGGGA
ncbi:cysteine-rich CWC family protein [Hydrogenophaga sp.]|uniref:cysteine-rich CWC family protein n=1 Tax=Hydrogenophaga sp. TaxID=1904254 RepID=UPI00261473F4|nr:cysteine-rich CWC family protein [Hydrogenophaga sp.]MDM7951282.1 cysteine-rich CWC family protein [Hydrogenophaga sp.]